MKTIENSNLDQASVQQLCAIREFLKTDSASEIVESLHFMIKSFLFSADLENVTDEMRTHIVNQLRVATLVSKLNLTCQASI